MHHLTRYLPFMVVLPWIWGCEEVLDLNIEPGPPQLAVDAWLTNEPGNQQIRLTLTAPYFLNDFAPPATGASVLVTDDLGRQFVFQDQGADGIYLWEPDSTEILGQVDRQYFLTIDYDGSIYTAQTAIKRVPEIDSIFYEFREEELGFPEGYYAEVYARDLVGPGDTYWIRTYKNGVFLNKPQEINIAYDAAFSPGGNFDGKVFITPIREAINRWPDSGDSAIDDDQVPPYALGDSVFVEIFSITEDAFYFLSEARIQMDRQGGVAELFASPIANVTTNVINLNPDGEDAVGYFAASAVSSAGVVIRED